MEKYSLLTKLAKCTLNIFSVFLFFFVFWLHFRPPRHCLRPFLERQFFTPVTVERREALSLLSPTSTVLSDGVLGPTDFPRSQCCLLLRLTFLCTRSVFSRLLVLLRPSRAAFYSIRWAHDIAGFDSPTNHTLPQKVVKSAKRRL